MTRAERRAAEQARWTRQQGEERERLAELIALAPSVPVTWNRRASVYGSIKGLRWRIDNRQARLDAMAAEDEREAAGRDGLASAMARLLGAHGGRWEGTAGDLLALLPRVAPDATRLARRLANAGMSIARRREAGTGRRVLVLTLADGREPEAARETVTNDERAMPLDCDADAPMLANAGIRDARGTDGEAARDKQADPLALIVGAGVAVSNAEADPLEAIYGAAVAAVMRRRR